MFYVNAKSTCQTFYYPSIRKICLRQNFVSGTPNPISILLYSFHDQQNHFPFNISFQTISPNSKSYFFSKFQISIKFRNYKSKFIPQFYHAKIFRFTFPKSEIIVFFNNNTNLQFTLSFLIYNSISIQS